jgi:hypothetical protein
VVAIYVLAVSDANDQDDETPTFDRVNHAIVADPEAVEPVLGVQEDGSGRTGILSQEIDFPRDAALGLLGEGGELPLGGGEELYCVGHAARVRALEQP